MMFDWQKIGFSVRAKSAGAIIYKNSPNSGEIERLAPGEIAGEITSFIKQGGVSYLQLNDNEYVKFDSVDIVDPGTEDESSFFSRIKANTQTVLENTSNKVEKSAGYLSDGIQATKERSFFEMLDFAGGKFALFSDVKKAIIVGVAMFGIYLITIIILKAK